MSSSLGMLSGMGREYRLDVVGMVLGWMPQDLRGGIRKRNKCYKPEVSYGECVWQKSVE